MASFEAEFEERAQGASVLIYAVGATVVLFLFWAKFAWIDEIVRGNGEVVSASRPQIIQNLEGGILTELLVAEGDEVAPGDVIARLGSAQFSSTAQDLAGQIAAAEIRRVRIEAEIEGLLDFSISDDLAAQAPAMLTSERALLSARQHDYATRLQSARAILQDVEDEKAMYESMLERGIVARVEVTAVREKFADAQARVSEIITTAELDRADEYSRTLAQLASLRQEMRAAEDRLSRTTITSPMHGVVNDLSVTTIGGVIRPGQQIAEIIPIGDDLYVEAQIKPQDIAHVVAGQEATIKLSAYDYTIYGSLKGTVEIVSADSFKDERRPDLPAHYKVNVRVDLSQLSERQRAIEIRPGMQATVELHTGEHTVLQYLTKPLYRGGEALREP